MLLSYQSLYFSFKSFPENPFHRQPFPPQSAALGNLARLCVLYSNESCHKVGAEWRFGADKSVAASNKGVALYLHNAVQDVGATVAEQHNVIAAEWHIGGQRCKNEVVATLL